MPGLAPRCEVTVRPSSTATTGPATGPAVLVRLAAADRRWVEHLPAVPGDRALTVSVGRPELLPVPAEDLASRGYRVVGVSHRVGSYVDVLVPLSFQTSEPIWWESLVRRAERVFDLRLGPVRLVLAEDLQLHAAG